MFIIKENNVIPYKKKFLMITDVFQKDLFILELKRSLPPVVSIEVNSPGSNKEYDDGTNSSSERVQSKSQ